MTNLSFQNGRSKKRFRPLLFLFPLLFLALILASFSACQKEADPLDYLSEYRSEIYLAETEEFSLRAYAVEKEHPFVADGLVGTLTKRVEFYLTAKDGSMSCHIRYFLDGEEHGGEASFDSVKREYYYSCAADLQGKTTLPVRITLGEQEYELTAHSVKTEITLSGETVLKLLKETESELFASLVSSKELLAELHLRLLYEDAPYYYIGVVERSGRITAFLMDGETGKILAKRQS